MSVRRKKHSVSRLTFIIFLSCIDRRMRCKYLLLMTVKGQTNDFDIRVDYY